MTKKKQEALKQLERLWAVHDEMERKIIHLERLFTDKELDSLLGRDA